MKEISRISRWLVALALAMSSFNAWAGRPAESSWIIEFNDPGRLGPTNGRVSNGPQDLVYEERAAAMAAADKASAQAKAQAEAAERASRRLHANVSDGDQATVEAFQAWLEETIPNMALRDFRTPDGQQLSPEQVETDLMTIAHRFNGVVLRLIKIMQKMRDKQPLQGQDEQIARTFRQDALNKIGAAGIGANNDEERAEIRKRTIQTLDLLAHLERNEAVIMNSLTYDPVGLFVLLAKNHKDNEYRPFRNPNFQDPKDRIANLEATIRATRPPEFIEFVSGGLIPFLGAIKTSYLVRDQQWFQLSDPYFWEFYYELPKLPMGMIEGRVMAKSASLSSGPGGAHACQAAFGGR